MEGKQYRFAKQFKATTTKASSKKGRKSQGSTCNLQTQYMVCAVTSFFFLALFGALAIRAPENCLVENPPVDGERCCECFKFESDTEAYRRMIGQEMPKDVVYNDVFYGVIMIINSVFGVYYVYSGVKSENKYLLFIMVLTQTLECGRGVLDIAYVETKPFPPILGVPHANSTPLMKHLREGMIVIACLLMFAGFFFLRPLYKKFGWRIFRRGGAKRRTRDMYKTFQRYRACNLLDIQSSFLLFVIYLLYLDVVTYSPPYVVFVIMFVSDILASRAMVKFMKQENSAGFFICLIAKLSVMIWWCCILGLYVSCYLRYRGARAETRPWFTKPPGEEWVRAPQLQSVYETYSGTSCLKPGTIHDATTAELIGMNFAQAMIFRLASIIIAFRVRGNFGEGLLDVFYKDTSKDQSLVANNTADEEDDDDYEPNSDDGKFSDEDDEEDGNSEEMMDAARGELNEA